MPKWNTKQKWSTKKLRNINLLSSCVDQVNKINDFSFATQIYKEAISIGDSLFYISHSSRYSNRFFIFLL